MNFSSVYYRARESCLQQSPDLVPEFKGAMRGSDEKKRGEGNKEKKSRVKR